jgi:hypothetical protein
VQMSFWADAKKSPKWAAVKDTEEVIKQAESPNNAYVDDQMVQAMHRNMSELQSSVGPCIDCASYQIQSFF